MLSFSHKMFQARDGMLVQQFLKNECVGEDLAGKKLGFIGSGYVGKHLIRLLANFDVEVLCYDIDEDAVLPWLEWTELDEVLANSDFVTIHTPLNAATENLFNANTLAKMKHGAALFNFARAEIVVDEHIIEYLKKGHLSGYVTDLVRGEPKHQDEVEKFFKTSRLMQERALLEAYKIIVTPHVGGNSWQARQKSDKKAARQMRDFFFKGVIPSGCVNFESYKVPPYTDDGGHLLIFHENIVGEMKRLLDIVSGECSINIGSQRNDARDGYAFTAMNLDTAPTTPMLEALKKVKGVVRVHYVGKMAD